MKSDYRYSASVVYNTFPWITPSDIQRAELESLAEDILFAREDHPGKTLAQLYNPESMPQDLLDAHQRLDRAVDKLYRSKPFSDVSDRLACLIERYEEMTTNQK
jgi:hypothetical protein